MDLAKSDINPVDLTRDLIASSAVFYHRLSLWGGRNFESLSTQSFIIASWPSLAFSEASMMMEWAHTSNHYRKLQLPCKVSKYRFVDDAVIVAEAHSGAEPDAFSFIWNRDCQPVPSFDHISAERKWCSESEWLAAIFSTYVALRNMASLGLLRRRRRTSISTFAGKKIPISKSSCTHFLRIHIHNGPLFA